MSLRLGTEARIFSEAIRSIFGSNFQKFAKNKNKQKH